MPISVPTANEHHQARPCQSKSIFTPSPHWVHDIYGGWDGGDPELGSPPTLWVPTSRNKTQEPGLYHTVTRAQANTTKLVKGKPYLHVFFFLRK